MSRADFHCLAYCPIRLPSPNHLTRPIVVRRHYRFAESPATLALQEQPQVCAAYCTAALGGDRTANG